MLTSGFGVGIRARVVTLTDAQLKALVTTGITIVAAPGASRMLQFLGAVISVDAQEAAYTNIDAAATLSILLGTIAVSQTVGQAANTGVGTLLATEADVQVAQLAPKSAPYFTLAEGTPNTIAGNLGVAPAAAAKTDVANKALILKATNAAAGDFTGGNAANSAVVTVFYATIRV